MNIYINLPVQDLQKSRQFYQKLGFSINEQFSDETAACVVFSEHIYVMILTHEKFQMFTPKTIANAHKETEVMNALSFDNKSEVDDLMNKALGNGATETRQTQDHGFMYSRAFNDLDGHIWELFWMDMSQFPK
jgi:predicted lactoylglutathione lyase